MRKCCLLLVLVLCFSFTAKKSSAQGLAVYVGPSLLSYKGDLTINRKVNFGAYFNYAGTLGGEYRFGDYFGADLHLTYGKLEHSQHSELILNSFSTKVINPVISGKAYFDHLFEKNTGFTPFFQIGVGALFYNTHGDLKDASGQTYYYWESDAQLHDREESDANASSSVLLDKDYEYETSLTGSKTALTVPIGLGFMYNLSENIDIKIHSTYNVVYTDDLDNYSVDTKKDIFWNTSVSLAYHFVKHEREEEVYESIDFANLFKGDADKDGVKDEFDECQNTAIGIKVDNKGCPLDTDGDGVADNYDKEANTVKGSVVDEYGVTLTDEMIETQHLKRDSTFSKVKSFYEMPSQETMKKFDEEIVRKQASGQAKQLPPQFVKFDSNKDGVITNDEITEALTLMLDGSIDATSEEVFKLIDYYFEQ